MLQKYIGGNSELTCCWYTSAQSSLAKSSSRAACPPEIVEKVKNFQSLENIDWIQNISFHGVKFNSCLLPHQCNSSQPEEIQLQGDILAFHRCQYSPEEVWAVFLMRSNVWKKSHKSRKLKHWTPMGRFQILFRVPPDYLLLVPICIMQHKTMNNQNHYPHYQHQY